MFRNLERSDWLMLGWFLFMAAVGYAAEHNLWFFGATNIEGNGQNVPFTTEHTYPASEWLGWYVRSAALAALPCGLFAMMFPRRIKWWKWHHDAETGERHEVLGKGYGAVLFNRQTSQRRFVGWFSTHRDNAKFLLTLPITYAIGLALWPLTEKDNGWFLGVLGFAGICLYIVGAILLLMWPGFVLAWAYTLWSREEFEEIRVPASSPFDAAQPAVPAASDENLR